MSNHFLVTTMLSQLYKLQTNDEQVCKETGYHQLVTCVSNTKTTDLKQSCTPDMMYTATTTLWAYSFQIFLLLVILVVGALFIRRKHYLYMQQQQRFAKLTASNTTTAASASQQEQQV